MAAVAQRVFRRGSASLALLTAAMVAPSSPADTPAGDAGALLQTRCVSCHQPSRKRGGLDLTTRETLLRGGDRGPAVVPGEARSSLLYRLVAHSAEPKMPHRQDRLAAGEISTLAAWIDAGAPYARKLVAPTAAAGRAELPALRPLKPVAVPAVDDAWCQTPVDRFVFATLRAKGLTPSPRADRYTLVRRATFDLTGLPPTPGEVDAFVRDGSPRAWERLVDRLLASPAYGERWGRHWLDVARYADSDGFEFDADRPNMYQYRDFVIRALNDDLPFDTFVRWSLAGDELDPDDPRARAATGFCTTGPVAIVNLAAGDGTPIDRERLRYDELDDVVSTFGAGLLGLSVGCARCHDHKFDPIPTRDYYGLVAVFAPSRRVEPPLASRAAQLRFEHDTSELKRRREKAQEELNEWADARVRELSRARIAALPIPEEEKNLLRGQHAPADPRWLKLSNTYAKALSVGDLAKELSPEQAAKWQNLKATLQEALRTPDPTPPARGLCLADVGQDPGKSYLLTRGQADKKGEEIGPAFLSALTEAPLDRWTKRPRPEAPTTYRRAALADWVTDVDAGAGRLLARVIVNRIWQHHFGEGLVRTPNDFGTQGEAPTHPELLDWLANELIAGKWRLKRLHRLIMTSAAYTQAVGAADERARADRDARLLSYRKPRRLEAEAVRDAILAVSGKLDRTMYGPAVKPALPADVLPGMPRDVLPRPTADGPAQWRRAVYLFVKRSLPTPVLEVLDEPPADASCGRRERSTVAPQALIFLNDEFVRTQARFFADRVASEAGADPGSRVRHAFRLTLGREPSDDEMTAALRFLRRRDGRAALQNFCHVLFTLNEFVYVD